MQATASSDSSSQGSTSPTWLEQIRDRNPDAWRRLTDLYGPLVYEWARRAGVDAADSADILQEVFLAVALSVESFTPSERGTFRGWLYTITRHKVLDHFRRRRRRDVAAGGTAAQLHLAELPAQWSDESNDATKSESRQLFRRALERIRSEFERRTWAAFWQTVVDGQDTRTVAAELGISANAVRQYKSRVLRRLRQELGDV
jgi:RNA polymerase sigma-70 factor (ECF subfamily)